MNEKPFSDMDPKTVEEILNRQATPFDWASVNGSDSLDALAHAAEGMAELLLFLTGSVKPRSGIVARRSVGLRAWVMLWCLHPERTPWSPGVAIPAHEMARRLGVHPNTVHEIAAEFAARFNLANSFQTHAWNRRKARQVKAIETMETEAITERRNTTS